jgi:ketosteroid isomerase-like protein
MAVNAHNGGRERSATPGRSSEHHVVVGLGFLSALKSGDIDACVEMLHPDVQWHPSPRQLDSEAMHGREKVRHQIRALYDRFGGRLEVTPEEGRQIGDHVLIVALLTGVNELSGQAVKSRECWVVSVRDDMWARIVAYPNAPAARLGFEELLRTSPVAETDAEPWTAHAPPDAEIVAYALEPAEPAAPAEAGRSMTLTFTLGEAAALHGWLARNDAGGDADALAGFAKIRSAVEHAQAVADVRSELEYVGMASEHLSDEQVAELALQISQALPAG